MASAPRRSSLVTSLKRLAPDEFENLSYDVLFLSGVQNLHWRTPSADGGQGPRGPTMLLNLRKLPSS
jgi:hypothetical protein